MLFLVLPCRFWSLNPNRFLDVGKCFYSYVSHAPTGRELNRQVNEANTEAMAIARARRTYESSNTEGEAISKNDAVAFEAQSFVGA